MPENGKRRSSELGTVGRNAGPTTIPGAGRPPFSFRLINQFRQEVFRRLNPVSHPFRKFQLRFQPEFP